MVKLSPGALASYGEKATAGALNRYFAARPLYVLKDVSLRQVVTADAKELNDGEWRYYTTAAFDFVVCNKDEDWSWEIVIEYDGLHHKEPLQTKKDALKNRLCIEAGLPIVRVGSDEILIRENMTFLQYILDLYFGEKEMERLKSQRKVAEDEDFFAGYGFPGTDTIEMRLIKRRGLVPAGLFDLEAVHGYRVLDQDMHTTRIEVLTGWRDPEIVLSIERSATITAINPKGNVLGVHESHLTSELARFLCFEALERELDRIGWPTI